MIGKLWRNILIFLLAEIEFTDKNNTVLLAGNRPNIVLLAESAPLSAQRLFNEVM
jgi:hypothetical protein